MKSPYARPVFFIKKKDGSWRPIQDYRKLNQATIKDKYPLPRIQDLLNELKGSRYYTKLDIIWGYNNIRIKKGDEWKAAFITNRGLFEPTVMYFGLTNSPSTFARMMGTIFRDLILKGGIIIYMDDIIIHANTKEELERLTKEVMKILEKHRLFIKASKSLFEVTKVPILGFVVEKDKVEMEEEKITKIKNWKTPENKKQLCQFLGFCNFYRRFIKDFGKIAKPLHGLTGSTKD